jgi:peptidoglycan/LPS O-acetylase OafA/YrhL
MASPRPRDAAEAPRAVLRYMPHLDGLRAVAVFAVLIHHFLGPKNLLNRIFPWGAIGVRLFFVLSGFLITGILLACRERLAARGGLWPTLRDFYARRFLRIFPAYYLTLAGAALLGVAVVREHGWWYVAYLSNVHMALMQDWPGRVSHFWSLAVEEQFYVVWPWLILFLPWRALVPVVAGLVAVAPLFRATALATLGPAGRWWATIFPLACVDSLGIGALLALAADGRARIQRSALLGWSLRVGLPLCFFEVLARLAFGDELLPHLRKVCTVEPGLVHAIRMVDLVVQGFALSLLFVWLVGRAADGVRGRAAAFLGAGAVLYLGRISYGVYLVHNFVPDLTGARSRIRALGLTGTAADAATFLVDAAVTLVLASASWAWFERPLIGLKRYFDYGSGRSG